MDAPTFGVGCSVRNNIVKSVNISQPVAENEQQDLAQQGMKMVVEIVKASNNLPLDEHRDYMSTFPEFTNAMTDEGGFILSVLSDVIRNYGISGNIIRRDSDEKYDLVIETNDAILERVDNNLDEIQGIKRNPEPIIGKITAAQQMNNKAKKIQDVTPPRMSERQIERSMVRLINTRITQRPQIMFKDKIDNRNIPFEPRIKEKPNALKQLAILVEEDEERGESFSHPYEYELDLFKPTSEQLQNKQPQKFKSLDEVPLLLVSDPATLEEMMKHLKAQKELAVDLEHHSYRTFQGFTCLVQISTREKDFIVDALELRDKLFVLNEVFTDPKIVKVFHGADSDIEWLQRDLCVYVVNMFDTHQAAQVLNFQRLSLAHLLKIFCNIDSNKTFQLYDWRTRPLSKEAQKYAREDTHYLLYIYDNLRASLIKECHNKTNLLESVIFRSTEICKKKYWKVRWTEDSHLNIYRKCRKLFDTRQMYALQHLFQWRDKIARDEDESYMYVLPNHMLLQIAETLPREMQGILACCNPVPPLVRQNLITLHQIILKARDQSLVKQLVETEVQRQIVEQQPNWTPVNIDSKLYCPHDLSHSDVMTENLPTVLGGGVRITPAEQVVYPTKRCSVTVLQHDEGIEQINMDVVRKHLKFVSPYQRYKKVLAFLEDEQAKLEGEAEKKGMIEEKNGTELLTEKQNLKRRVNTETANFDSVNDPTLTDDVKAEMLSKKVDEFETSRRLQEKKRKHHSNSPDGKSAGNESKDSTEQYKKKRKKENIADTFESPKRVEKEINEASPAGILENVSKEGNYEETVPVQNFKVAEDSAMTDKTHENEEKKKKRKSKEPQDTISEATPQKKAKQSESFKPFNYNSVDFSKFQIIPDTQKKTPQPQKNPQKNKGRRTPWLGKKMKKAGI